MWVQVWVWVGEADDPRSGVVHAGPDSTGDLRDGFAVHGQGPGLHLQR